MLLFYISLFVFLYLDTYKLEKRKHYVNSSNKYKDQTYIKLFQTGPTGTTCTAALQTPATAREEWQISQLSQTSFTVNIMLTSSGQHN